jgi:2-oxoglutarate ferredoxin oxidoreductase subunit delta
MPLFKVEKKAPRGPAGRWDVVIGEEMCKACGFCLNVCPVDVFAYRTATNKLGWFPMYVAHEENCVGCMLCYQICPDFCIDVAVRGEALPSGEPSPSMTGVVKNGSAN